MFIMRSFQSQNHAVWNCQYHIVIVPKYRKKVLYGHTRTHIGKMLRELAKQKECEILEGGVPPDHIHFLISIPPKYSVAYIVGFLKGKSAIKSHNTFCKKNRVIAQKSLWARGYFVSTVGLDEETVRKYVRNQLEEDRIQDHNPRLDLSWDS
jgi:putative transposase